MKRCMKNYNARTNEENMQHDKQEQINSRFNL
jgi:hypothetical protein